MNRNIIFPFAGFAVCIVVLLICGLISSLLPQRSELRDGNQPFSVPMIDPAGRDPERDLTNSQTNLNNSKANLNNAQVEKILAEAKAIAAQSDYADPLYLHKEISGMTADAFNRGSMFIAGCIGVFVILFVIFRYGK